MPNENSLTTLNKFTDYFSSLASDFNKNESLDKIRELNAMVGEMENFLREEYQNRNERKVKQLISSISSNPSSSELELLENFVVGDAKVYLKESEFLFQESKKVLKDYAGQIEDIDEDTDDSEYLLNLLGKVKVLQNNVKMMNKFIQERQRLENFRSSVNDGIDKDEAKFFQDIMKFKLKSS